MDARKFLKNDYITTAQLKQDGPLLFHIKEVARDSKAFDGGPAVESLVLVSTDGKKCSLRTGANLKRVIEFFGHEDERWPGNVIELYFSPDVRGPQGQEGGIRLRKPSAGAVVPVNGGLDLLNDPAVRQQLLDQLKREQAGEVVPDARERIVVFAVANGDQNLVGLLRAVDAEQWEAAYELNGAPYKSQVCASRVLAEQHLAGKQAALEAKGWAVAPGEAADTVPF